tara:strand:- start:6563 stop:7165 length:603 start_codon:yes stop_codon:yes gene_type:complete
MSRNATYTPNATQVVTLAEAKSHLRVDFSEDDAYINSLCMAAQETFENYCNVILMDTTISQFCSYWTDTQQLYHSPISGSGEASVTSIEYFVNGTLTTWPNTNYIPNIHACPVTIWTAENETYPTQDVRPDAIKIIYKIGYNNIANVPDGAKQAIKILVGQWYENRQEAVVGRSVGRIPMTATYLMNKYKIATFGLPTFI